MGGSAVTSLWLILPCVVVLGFSSEEQKNFTAKCGDTVILPCRRANNINVVEWSRPDLNPECVILYRNKQFDPLSQNPAFKNRVDLKMNDGNVTLTLKDVTTADSGTYECRILTNRKKRAVQPVRTLYLSVVDPPGQTGGDTEDGGKEDGSVGLVFGLSIVAVAVVLSAAVVLILIYRKHKQCNQDSHPPPAEPQIEMSESFLNSESPAAEYNDRNDLEANNCHDQSTRIPDVTLTLENELLHPPPQETAGLLPESDMRVQ